MTLHRALGGEVRAAGTTDGRHTITLRAITPGVVDDYGSVWMADAFDAELAVRLPVLAWCHDWSDPIGAGLDYMPSDQGPMVTFVFDDFDAVPRARQAYEQTRTDLPDKPPTIRDCSVGFSKVSRREPTDEERTLWPGVREVITRARMDELSLVLAGAVPGATVAGVRMANTDGPVSREAVAKLLAQIATGELTLTAALNALEALDGLDTGDDDDKGQDDKDGPEGADGGDQGAQGSGEGADPSIQGDEAGAPTPDPELDAAVDALMAEAADAIALAGGV